MCEASTLITGIPYSESNTNGSITQPLYKRIVQNFCLVWLDTNIDDCSENIRKLRRTIHVIHTLTDAAQCIELLKNIKDEMVFLVVTGYVGEHLIPTIHDITQLYSVYILCGKQSKHQKWIQKWSKIRGVFTEASHICDALKKAAHQCDEDYISIGFLPISDNPSTETLNKLDQSFMYTQILKEILLNIEFNESHIKEFTDYCRKHVSSDAVKISIVDELEENYDQHTPIWWYTDESFLYSMLNRALRQMEVDIIIKMGFFVSDLHRQIEQLYIQQCNDEYLSKQFTVYRGQALPVGDFDRMMKTKGGLISFNNFLSTSREPQFPLECAMQALTKHAMTGILFEISVDPTISSAPFAAINEFGHFENEQEILFSMHSVFQITEIAKFQSNDRLWQVKLTTTSDNDTKLLALTERIRQETQGYSGWHELANFLINVGSFKKAEQLLEILLHQASNSTEKSLIYNLLGIALANQGYYAKALSFYKQELEIIQQTLLANHPNLATSLSNIGQLYSNMGEYSKALSFHEKALKIRQESLPENHPDLATSLSNIGQVYCNMGEYSKALPFYEKALKIREESLPANHPDLATSLSSIGQLYSNMGEYSKALSFYEKALKIRQENLPANHPNLAISLSNIGQVYSNMGEYSKALSFYEKAHAIFQESLPANHPSLATSLSNIGQVYSNMGEYSKALSFYEKAHAIDQESLPANHPSLAMLLKNIGQIYNYLGDSSRAIDNLERALDISKISLPEHHPILAVAYSILGQVYNDMGEYEKALVAQEKALNMKEIVLNTNYPELAVSYSNIGEVYCNMGEYAKALTFHEKALQAREKSLSVTHPDIAVSYNNMGLVYGKMGDHSKALSFYEQAIAIRVKALPEYHPYLAVTYDNLGKLYEDMGDYAQALLYYERARNIAQVSLPENHPHRKRYKNHVEFIKSKL
jgi:tetratricopeptide (TPR) repeat protein